VRAGILWTVASARRTVRQRFTALYGGLFLLSAVGLLALTNLLGTSVSVPAPTRQPAGSALATAQARIAVLEEQLATVEGDQARRLLVGSGIALLVMAVVSVVLGRVVAGRVLRPLRTITAATRRITADNLHQRLAVTGPADEVKDLADTVDELLERLEGAFAAQRRFVANASHELRTPLTTMRASLDVAVAKPEPVPAQTVALAERLRAELDLVDRLLEGFLTLARAQHTALPDRAPVRLGELVSAALAARAAAVTVKRLTVDTADVDPGAAALGSPTLLARLVDNAIDNAVRHNVDGGWIRVAVGAPADLVVETGGPVLDPAQVAGLAEPFRRLGADRTGSQDGSGLGLSIVAAIAAAHGGRLDLRARESGGLRVRVELPAAVGVPA
jgi:signal transduction histidine kinase